MTDWTTTAFLFPGQGSQEVGMGADLAAAYPAAQAIFEQADDLLGFSLSGLCWQGPADALTDTFNTQPALYITSIATLKALEAEVGSIQPAYVAGHSLGELTALTAAGALSFEDGLRLVRERGRLMKQTGEQNPGAMAAILGLSVEAIQSVCELTSSETGKTLVLANDNCPGQIVISGDVEAIERGMTLAQEAGAKRVVKLPVSIASHSPLMTPIVDEFQAALAQTTFTPPTTPIIGNVTAAPLPADPDAIRRELSDQLTSSVRWTESMQILIDNGITSFVEIGTNEVLSGLMRRINRKSTRVTLNNAQKLGEFTQSLTI
ncbi:ACP S-malonyltransferase [Chloroflexota bacterium]